MSEIPSDSPSLTLVTVGDCGSATDRLRAILGTADPPIRLAEAGSVREAADEAAAGPVVLVLQAPDDAIARAIGAQVPPSRAAADWYDRTSALAADLRRMRQRLTVFDGDSLARTPAACAEALSARLGTALGVPDTPRTETTPPEHALFRVLAAHLLRQTPHWRNLAEEIAALTVKGEAGADTTPERLDAACMALHSRLGTAAPPNAAPSLEPSGPEATHADLLQEAELLRADLAEQRQQIEADSLNAELHEAALRSAERTMAATEARFRMREAVLAAALLRNGAESELAATAEELEETYEALHAAQARVGDLEATLAGERERLTEAAAQVERDAAELTRRSEEIEALTGRISDLASRLAAAEAQAAEASEELDRLYASRTWKAVNALRMARHSQKK